MIGKERVTRSIEWKNPNSLVVEWGISARTWLKYREALEPIARRMPNDFYQYAGPTDYDKMPPGFGQDEYYEDPWGCLWHCRAAGMQGIIERHPLASWDAFGVNCRIPGKPRIWYLLIRADLRTSLNHG
ncbi:MAG: hypothetical protein LBE10_09130 [Treponema sp.]|jgi:hypothetical protein|nr:hypothetical protein [Treponema sp.]